ncbi:MAG: hypothetical protein R3C17_12340 [Planctomycetaceae bacterium]
MLKANWFEKLWLMALTIPALCGCAEEPAKTVIPAEGTLTIDGVGAANVMVRFVPSAKAIEGDLSSTGITDEQGAFRLVASDGREGAIPGAGYVLLVDLDEERPAQGEEATKLPRFPAELGVLSERSITAEVVANTPLKIQLPVQ